MGSVELLYVKYFWTAGLRTKLCQTRRFMMMPVGIITLTPDAGLEVLDRVGAVRPGTPPSDACCSSWRSPPSSPARSLLAADERPPLTRLEAAKRTFSAASAALSIVCGTKLPMQNSCVVYVEFATRGLMRGGLPNGAPKIGTAGWNASSIDHV